MTIQINDTWLRAIAARYDGELYGFKKPFVFKSIDSKYAEKMYTAAVSRGAAIMFQINSEYEVLDEMPVTKRLRQHFTQQPEDRCIRVDVDDIKTWAGEHILLEPCDKCGTDGKIPCNPCDESGKLFVDPEGFSEETIPCSACQGIGYTKCDCGNKDLKSELVVGDLFGLEINKLLLALMLYGIGGQADLYIANQETRILFVGDEGRVAIMPLRPNKTKSEDHYPKEAA